MSKTRTKTNPGNPFHDPSLQKRHAQAKRFKFFTIASIVFAISFLVFFLGDMIVKGLPAFQQSYMLVDVTYNDKTLDSTRKAIDKKYRRIVSRAWLRDIPNRVENNPSLMNTTEAAWVLVNHQVDQYMKGHYYKIKDKALNVVKEKQAKGELALRFNRLFFTHGDSKIPENSGIKSAIIGSILTLLVTMVIAFPLGVMTAIYLEEFAK